MTFKRIVYLASLISAFCVHASVPIMPVSEVKPGMRGQWHTVVQGTKIESFELEVLGVIPNFVGPKQSVIFCKALSPDQILVGGVQGMSGSPVYIDGKLVGAYAYGFNWAKDQALIGISPIEEMLKVLDQPDAMAFMGPGYHMRTSAATKSLVDLPVDVKAELGLDPTIPICMNRAPMPLMAGGFSPKVLSYFERHFNRLGVQVRSAPVGGSANAALADPEAAQPGSALAAVLMDGDFKMAAVGTLTWRDGKRILAFGHPFLQEGPVRIPMATAEVVTIVQNYEASFKLAKVGRVIGAFTQDRLTATAGEIGLQAPVTHIQFDISHPEGKSQSFEGNLFENQNLTPIIAAAALMESLSCTLEAAKEQTFRMQRTWNIHGFAPVVMHAVYSGPAAIVDCVEDFMRDYKALLENPFEFPRVESINFSIEVQNSWLCSSLRHVQLVSGPIHPGETVEVSLLFDNYQQSATRMHVHVPIPKNMADPHSLSLWVLDSESADKMDLGSDRDDYLSLSDLLNNWRKRHSQDTIFVRLVQKAPGLRVEGASLPGLPPSRLYQYESSKSWGLGEYSKFTTLWSQQIKTPGVFSGKAMLPVDLAD